MRRRRRKIRHKDRIVEERGYRKITLEEEYVAELPYRPTKCRQEYRVVAVWKELSVSEGQPLLFKEESRIFFYITNDWDSPPEEIVAQARSRCNQENTVIQQLKSDVRALTAPLDTLDSNWAYMVIAMLARHLPRACRERLLTTSLSIIRSLPATDAMLTVDLEAGARTLRSAFLPAPTGS